MKIVIINCPEVTEDMGGIKYRHAPNTIEGDRTLCGIAFEGHGNKNSGYATEKNGTVNCSDCIKIIRFCKAIPSNAITKKQRGVQDA